jgi:hypothetical protein
MSRRSRCAIVLCVSVLACSVRAAAQKDPSWTERFEPFRIADNLYFVGTRGVSSFLFVTPQGNILLDTGVEEACITWSTRGQHNGKSLFLVMIGGTSINDGVKLLNNMRHPSIVEDYARTFRVLKELKPDMFVARHPSMFRMEDKVAHLKGGDANAFIDPQGYQARVSSNEQAYLTQLKKEQGK